MRIAISIGFLAALVVVWLFDLAAIFGGRANETVSVTLRDWAARWPVLPFAGGVLAGHILWPG